MSPRRAGGRRLRRLLRRWQPAWLAVVGITAYRIAFDDPGATVGPQERTIGPTRLWALPNTSGLNAAYQLRDLVAAFAELRAALA